MHTTGLQNEALCWRAMQGLGRGSEAQRRSRMQEDQRQAQHLHLLGPRGSPHRSGCPSTAWSRSEWPLDGIVLTDPSGGICLPLSPAHPCQLSIRLSGILRGFAASHSSMALAEGRARVRLAERRIISFQGGQPGLNPLQVI